MISTEWLVLHAKTKPSILFSDGPKSYIWYFICSLFPPPFVSKRAFLQYLIPRCTVSSQFGLRGESQILKVVVSVPLGCRELNPPSQREKLIIWEPAFQREWRESVWTSDETTLKMCIWPPVLPWSPVAPKLMCWFWGWGSLGLLWFLKYKPGKTEALKTLCEGRSSSSSSVIPWAWNCLCFVYCTSRWCTIK